MNKQQFLAAIAAKLQGLPQADIDKSLDFWEEMIDDRVEDGMTEEAAVAAMGSAEEIAAQILMDAPLPHLIRRSVDPGRALRGWEIALLILGSPVWLPLLAAAIIVFLALYIVLWSVVLSLYTTDLALAASGLGCLFASAVLFFTGAVPSALWSLGTGLIGIGTAILLFLVFHKITAGILWMSKQLILSIKSAFVGKGNEK